MPGTGVAYAALLHCADQALCRVCLLPAARNLDTPRQRSGIGRTSIILLRLEGLSTPRLLTRSFREKDLVIGNTTKICINIYRDLQSYAARGKSVNGERVCLDVRNSRKMSSEKDGKERDGIQAGTLLHSSHIVMQSSLVCLSSSLKTSNTYCSAVSVQRSLMTAQRSASRCLLPSSA